MNQKKKKMGAGFGNCGFTSHPTKHRDLSFFSVFLLYGKVLVAFQLSSPKVLTALQQKLRISCSHIHTQKTNREINIHQNPVHGCTVHAHTCGVQSSATQGCTVLLLYLNRQQPTSRLRLLLWVENIGLTFLFSPN